MFQILFILLSSLTALGSPEVPVVMPVWNRADVMSESIESVRAQTFRNWELILVDDGSQDGTLEVAQSFSQLDSRIQVLSFDHNQGVAAARNAAIDKAQGNYVAFLDSDDLWLPQKLDKQINFMKSKGVRFSFTGFEVGKVGDKTFYPQENLPPTISYSESLKQNQIGTLTVMLERSLLSNARFGHILPEDWSLWLRLLKSGVDKAHLLPENLAVLRVSNDSISRNKILQAQRVWNMFRTEQKFGVLKSAYYFLYWAENAAQKYYLRYSARNSCKANMGAISLQKARH